MAPRKEKRNPPSPEALTLVYLRAKRGWRQKEMASRTGIGVDTKVISRFERGDRPLLYERLVSLAGTLGYSPAVVDMVLSFHDWIEPRKPAEPSSPVDPTPEEQIALEHAVHAATAAFMGEVSQELIWKKRERKADAARRKAREIWPLLRAAPRQEQRELVKTLPQYQGWALAVHVCEASVRAAAHKPDEALHLADLAVLIATKSPGSEGWRSRLAGFCWAHLANARRVANDFAGADKAFARAWELWKAGTVSTPELLPEWRMLDLEASLRREQHRFQEALELLTRASAGVGANPVAAARILLKKEHVLEQMGDIQGALNVLWEATPLVEASKDSRLLFALRFNTADNLCQLKRYDQAKDQLTSARDAALQQGNELDLVRVVWLESRVAVGQGQIEQAIEGLQQVRRDFTARELPYDAARASLELAALYLEKGRSSEVRALARTMTWIFQAQGITREALAALTLFCEAAQRETATVELTRRVLAELERSKPSTPPPICRQRGRG